MSTGHDQVRAPMMGTVVHVAVEAGAPVRAGRTLVVLESMKMEHPVTAPYDAVVGAVEVAVGDVVRRDQLLAVVAAADLDAEESVAETVVERRDLAEVQERHAVGLDARRPEAVARRRARGQRTARENLEDLCDPGTFVEYGPLVIAAQRGRRPLQELVERTPADGLVAGLAEVDGVPVAALSYDATVLAGTQGARNHQKTDRLFDVARRRRLPVVLFAEGGGGRPGDTDIPVVASLDVSTFSELARLSGTVPLVGIASGRCFAGNAALLGCCDVVVATRDSTIGMGGPAMIEGGGLGVHTPEEVGPIDVQGPNGVVDVVVEDEAEAVRVAQAYLSYVAPGRAADRAWTAPDQALLRDLVPESRVTVYDVRQVVTALADEGAVLELRREFGVGVVTALVRIEGRAHGVVANNPAHLGGAIDRDAADKVARFLQLCEAHDLPIVSLCDTPGFMVGPDSEQTATVRHFSRLFVGGANLTVPMCLVVLRKAYGLGAMAMAGGSTKVPLASVAWPTGELGAMGVEGAVRLGFRRELDAAGDDAARQRLFDELVEAAYEQGRALNAATMFEIDDVIDPADTRRWIVASLGRRSAEPRDRAHGDRRPFIDTW